MIDRIIDSALDTATPSITKWRLAFLFLSLVLFSPKVHILFNENIFKISIENIGKNLTTILLSSNLSTTLLSIILILYVLPELLYFMLRRISEINIKNAEPLINELTKLRARPKNELEEIISSSFDTKQQLAKKSTNNLSNLKDYCEIAFLSPIFYIATSLHLEVFNYILALTIFILSLFIIYYISTKILIVYLRDIAPFRILEDYVKYVILIK